MGRLPCNRLSLAGSACGHTGAAIVNASERNRAEVVAHGMGCVAEWVDALRSGGFEHAAPVYIEAQDGWTVGKRDPGPWVDGIAMVRAVDAHRKWFGVVNRQPDAAPKRRGMTDAQRACLRGDV